MSLQLGESTLGVWSVFFRTGNWLAHLAGNAEGRYELTYRFRWYRDALIGRDSKDERNFYRVTFKDALDAPSALARAREIFSIVQSAPFTERAWELLRGARSVEEFASLLGEMPGMHRECAFRPRRSLLIDSIIHA